MIQRLSKRVTQKESQGGFTLIELLVVIIIIGILLAIAIPSYLSFRGRAEKSAAQADVRAAIPGVEAFYADHNTYSALTSAVLKASYHRHVVLHPEHGRPEHVQEGRPCGRHHVGRLLVQAQPLARKGAGDRALSC